MRDSLADEEMIPTWVDGQLAPMGKMAVHRAGLKHKAVSVFVTDANRVLIQRRALTKYHTPGLWANTCCTHPRWNEDSAACAVRRLREELGISGLFPAFADRVEYRADVGGGLTEHEVVDIFVAELTPAMTLEPNPDEVADVAWIDMYDLSADTARNPARYTPWLQIYMAEHMGRIFGAAVR